MTAPVEPDAVEGRRTALRRQRRRRRRRLVALALGVLAVLTLALTVELATDPSAPPPPAAADVERTQRTLLLQVQAPNGEAAGTVLLAHDPEAGTGSGVLVPPQTLVTVPGYGSLSVGRALRSVPPLGSRNAVADALGVLVDDGWVLDQPSLVRLVDLLGGVAVGVDVPVQRAGTLLLQPGSQRLDGEQAVAYLTYLADGEQEQARLARVQRVLEGLLDSLPDSAPDTVPVLAQLGARSISTLPPDELAEVLVGLEEADSDAALQFDTLPVVPLDTGAGVGAFRVDVDATRTVVDRLLSASVPPGSREPGNRVLVLNGVGTPGIGEQVRAKLVPQGFVFVDSRNADRFGYARTLVLVPGETAEAQALGTRVASVLGLQPDAVRSSDRLGSVADVVVLVGADFRA